MEGIIKSLAELVGAISSPIQVITVFIIVVAIVAVFIIKRGGFHAVLESSRRKWSRRTFLIVLAASIFFVLLLLIIVIVGLVQLDKIDLLKSVEKPGSDLLDIPETAVVLADEEYRQLVDRARRAFDEQNYEETAVLYQQLSAAVADNDTSVGDYQGLVTASLFGAGRHEEGLEYLCGLYQGQEKADRRHRHRAHAHIRVFAYQNGFAAAGEMLSRVRRQPGCDREDFTPVFAGIPLEVMRSIKLSNTLVGTRATRHIRREDRSFLLSLIDTNVNVHFLDHAHFTLENNETLLEKYPHSYIRDLALLSLAERAPIDEGIELLLRYLKEFPRGPRRSYVISRLVYAYSKTGDIDQATKLVAENVELFSGYRNYDPAFPVRLAFSEQCEDIVDALDEARFKDIVRIYEQSYNQLLEYYGDNFSVSTDVPSLGFSPFLCLDGQLSAVRMSDLIQFAKKIARLQESRQYENLLREAIFLKRCGDWRDDLPVPGDIEMRCSRIMSVFPWRVSFHKSALTMLNAIASNLTRSEDASRALFLVALTARRSGDLKMFYESLKEYVFQFPQAAFTDDAYAELGWYYAVITMELSQAERMWRHVEEHFSDSNAYDNSLNWLVILYRHQGRFAEALTYSTRLLSLVVSERIVKRIAGRHQDIQSAAAALPDLRNAPIRLVTNWTSFHIWGSYSPTVLKIWEVSEDAQQYKILEGVTVDNLGGRKVDNVEQALGILVQRKEDGFSSVSIEFHDEILFEKEEIKVPLELFGI